MSFEQAMENIALGFEVVGVAIIIVVGGVPALFSGLKECQDLDRFFLDIRRSFGHPLILGLEVLREPLSSLNSHQ